MTSKIFAMFGAWIILVLCSTASGNVLITNTSEVDDVTYDTVTTSAPKGVTKLDFRIVPLNCSLRSLDKYTSNEVKELVNLNLKLIEFNLHFPKYDVNPLTVNNTWTYRGTKWARAYSQHGQTLLSLAFNYGVMSLMTLTLGVKKMEVNLTDEPFGCLGRLNETEKISAVLNLLMRDFDHTSRNYTLQDKERICHEIIHNNGKQSAKFTDNCCHISPITNKLECTTDIINFWLRMLLIVLVAVKYAFLFFGPLLFIPFIESIAKDDFPYVVELKDPLVRRIFLCNSDSEASVRYDRVLDLRGKKRLRKFKESIKDLPLGEVVKVKFKRYDILIDYRKLLTENIVPVGLTNSITDALCKCKIRHVGPFVRCCATDMFKNVACVSAESPWISIFKVIAKVLVVLLLPFPFYIRLFIFYNFENEELENREEHLRQLGMRPTYEGSILTYLHPTHWLFVAIYIVYFVTTTTLGFVARGPRKERIASIVVGSFRDLKNLSYIEALGLIAGNFIWPFTRYGVIGIIIAPVYWLIVMPLTIIVYLYYCLPSIYVAVRMLLRSQSLPLVQRHPSGRYKVVKEYDRSMHRFEIDNIASSCTHSELAGDEEAADLEAVTNKYPTKLKDMHMNKKFVVNTLLSILCVLTMLGTLIVMSEVVGFLVELGVFTMMGVIVNAGAVLKYVTLLILVVVYSYDTYNNVGKKYLKLNKALFNEVKNRCKNIDKVTSMPSHLQENHGFKSQELSEQADYEESDDIAIDRRTPHWLINDLVLFVDNEDMPRIPQKLFEEVCQIQVAGAPGPIYRSLIEATQEFLKILVFIFFVFVVVLTFGAVYEVSSTNQMLAALVGGFLPFIMKTFMAPTKPDIEIGTVSFKSKLDEIIKNFKQRWPVYDVAFEPWTEEDDKELEEKENEKKEGEGKKEEEKKDGDDSKKGDENKNGGEREKNQETPIPVMNTFGGENRIEQRAGEGQAPFLTVPQPTSNNLQIPSLTGDVSLSKDSNHNHVDIELKPLPSVVVIDDEGDVIETVTQRQQSENKFDVDILIYLPTAKKQRSDWLAEWSDFDHMSISQRTHDDVSDFDDEEEQEEEAGAFIEKK